MNQTPRALAVHDISCVGRCSLTVALPILSAAGIECSVLPTAVLSTHTGGFTDYTYRDLTDDIPAIMRHWQALNLSFDGIYTGFLGSEEQLSMVSGLFDAFRSDKNCIVVDPVMADNGRLYPVFTQSFARGMAMLCAKADVIVPNMTEAAFLLGRPYEEGPYTEDYIRTLLVELSEMGPDTVVLTGVHFDRESLGAAVYHRKTGETFFSFAPLYPGFFHGTGDVFASALTSALLRGFDRKKAVDIAVSLTVGSIRRTAAVGTDPRFGVHFEAGLAEFSRIMAEGR